MTILIIAWLLLALLVTVFDGPVATWGEFGRRLLSPLYLLAIPVVAVTSAVVNRRRR